MRKVVRNVLEQWLVRVHPPILAMSGVERLKHEIPCVLFGILYIFVFIFLHQSGWAFVVTNPIGDFLFKLGVYKQVSLILQLLVSGAMPFPIYLILRVVFSLLTKWAFKSEE